jgi:polyhydroxyalkanoate synthase
MKGLPGRAAGTLRFAGRLAIGPPQAMLQSAPGAGVEMLRIALGRSEIGPEMGDKRFSDQAWQQNPVLRATMQAYLYFGAGVDDVVDSLGLDGRAAERMRFALILAREAMAPTNFFWSNPAAVKRCYDTGGRSVWRGAVNLTRDMLRNHGMPSMVDRRPFKLGENLAISPGAVIHRSEVFELIQYAPPGGTVYERPLLVVPPQVNKYYALDLSPGRSMYEYLLQRGIQVFTISWRNPTGAQRDWNYDTYAQAVIEAIDVIRQVSGSPDVNIMGGCLGGMTAAVVQAHLAALGERLIHSATLTVTMLDCDSDGRMFLFATPPALALAKQVSRPRGVIEGWQLGSMFSWLRPNDLVWNYWVNNYLLGQDPPAFDILAWNADQTRLSSAFHRQMLDMTAGNKLVRPGGMTVLGTPIDISRIDCDSYVVAGRTDHITPWKACYRTTQMVSGRTQFVLVSSGHIQTVVADPKHHGLGYYLNPETPPESEEWLAHAERHEGSWWEHWAGWLGERSGQQIAAPGSLGSSRYPAKEPAPGSYVRQ